MGHGARPAGVLIPCIRGGLVVGYIRWSSGGRARIEETAAGRYDLWCGHYLTFKNREDLMGTSVVERLDSLFAS